MNASADARDLGSAGEEERLLELPRQVAARALADAAAIIVWGWVAVAVVRALVDPDAYNLPAYALTVGSVVAVAGVYALPAVRRSERLLLPVTVVGMLVIAGAIAAFDAQAPHPLYFPNPAISLVGAASLVAGLVLGAWLGAAVALLLALWHGWWELGPLTGRTVGPYLASVITATTNFVGARFVATSLVRSAREVGALVSRLLADRRTDRIRQVREISRITAQTDVHDTVLTTLSGIGAGWLSSADPAVLRHELRRDERALGAPSPDASAGSVDLAEALEDLAAGGRFAELHIDVQAPDTPVRVDAVVADGLLLATREALVNVVRHAGVDTASVRLSQGAGELVVTVRDEGRGAGHGLDGDGLGIRGIEARMREVGGSAVIESTPGGGTTVTLHRPHRRADVVPPLWSVEGPRRGALGLTVVASVAATASFAVQAPGYTVLWPQLTALALVLAGDVVTVGVILRRRALPGWVSAVLIARIPVVLVLSGLPLEGCLSMGYALFTGGGQVIMCVVIALLRPWPDAATALLAYAVGYGTLAAPLYASGESCGITAVNQTGLALSYVVAGIWFTHALRRHAGIAADVLTAEEELRAARATQAERAAERQRLLPVIRGIVTDTISGLLDGRLDPADPDVRRRCRTDARMVRSFLTQAGNGDDLLTELFARSVAMRETGVDLAVRGTLPRDTVAGAARTTLLDGLDHTLALLAGHGWGGQAWVTVLRTDTDVLVTAVFHSVPDAVDVTGLHDVLAAEGRPEVRRDRTEMVEEDLWVTWRLPLMPPPAAASSARA